MSSTDDTNKMLRVIINGQSAFRQEVLGKIDKLDVRISQAENNLAQRINEVEKNLTSRIDNLGKQLAYLEDDTPTREEFDKLERKVTKLEKNPIPVL